MTASPQTTVLQSRRAMLAAGAALLACSSAGWAQQAGRTYRIGYVYPRDQTFAPYIGGFFAELRRHGFVEGTNLAVDFRFDTDIRHLDAVATEVVGRAPDAILCFGPVVVRAMQRATLTIPILSFEPLSENDASNSLARPDRNTTGISLAVAELDGKHQDILLELLPSARHLAVLADTNMSRPLPAMREATNARGVELSIHSAATPDEIGPAIEAAEKAGAEALDVLSSPMFWGSREAIYDGAARARLPAIYEWAVMAAEGGLIAYGPDGLAAHRQLARQLVKVLDGTKPADLPVEQPTQFELAVNLKTAKALGVAIPPSILIRANEVIK
jgi:putative tryptophan/tyrosine transport system substrate-binding protein